MDQILKQARLLKAVLNESELSLINAQALRPLTADEVFTFRLAACNNQVDRDIERFTEKTLEGLAVLFVGRPVLMDHKWSAGSQTARVYAAGVPMSSYGYSQDQNHSRSCQKRSARQKDWTRCKRSCRKRIFR